jgi:hypothetical protein
MRSIWTASSNGCSPCAASQRPAPGCGRGVICLEKMAGFRSLGRPKRLPPSVMLSEVNPRRRHPARLLPPGTGSWSSYPRNWAKPTSPAGLARVFQTRPEGPLRSGVEYLSLPGLLEVFAVLVLALPRTEKNPPAKGDELVSDISERSQHIGGISYRPPPDSRRVLSCESAYLHLQDDRTYKG